MAIRAPHIALLDLRDDEFPRLPGCDESDVAALRAGVAMIKLKNKNVGFTAVNAGMR